MQKTTKKDSDYQGINRLLMDATISITDIVEDMHHRIVHPPYLPSTPIQNLITQIAGFTYKNIRWSTKVIGGGLDKILGRIDPLIGELKITDNSEAIRAALNGVVGDYLEEKKNPLKITMQFRHLSKIITLNKKSLQSTFPETNGKILLMVHGSCMNDIQWTRKDHNHGLMIAKELDKTPIYLHYNSGLHISTNGQNLNELLEKLTSHWPVSIEELVIVAHSMGGLVTRSAIHYGLQQQKKWTKHLKKIVFLGTPHHGAPLEKTGSYLDATLEAIPYTKPLARLAKIRSAGVTDLRYGNIIDEDWQDNDRFEIKSDQRQPIPLPSLVACYAIAASIGKATASISGKILGDTLVEVESALGKHKDPDKDLHFKEKNTWIAYKNSHLDLLNNPFVYEKIKEWLL
jgi:pimeloyl-ACP methyl ester carboxylesterase